MKEKFKKSRAYLPQMKQNDPKFYITFQDKVKSIYTKLSAQSKIPSLLKEIEGCEDDKWTYQRTVHFEHLWQKQASTDDETLYKTTRGVCFIRLLLVNCKGVQMNSVDTGSDQLRAANLQQTSKRWGSYMKERNAQQGVSRAKKLPLASTLKHFSAMIYVWVTSKAWSWIVSHNDLKEALNTFQVFIISTVSTFWREMKAWKRPTDHQLYLAHSKEWARYSPQAIELLFNDMKNSRDESKYRILNTMGIKQKRILKVRIQWWLRKDLKHWRYWDVSAVDSIGWKTTMCLTIYGLTRLSLFAQWKKQCWSRSTWIMEQINGREEDSEPWVTSRLAQHNSWCAKILPLQQSLDLSNQHKREPILKSLMILLDALKKVMSMQLANFERSTFTGTVAWSK